MKKIINIDNVIIFLFSIVGLILRINFINNIPTKQLFDFQTYYDVANNIYNHLGFTLDNAPIAFQGMGYSTLLGVWFKIFGDNSEILAKYLNVFMSMLTIYIVYYIVSKITKKRIIIYFSTLLTIFLPSHIAYCNAIGTEVMSAFLLSFFIAIQITDFNWKIKYPVLGSVIGVMALTKPFFLAYPILVALVIWLKSKDLKDTLKILVITTAFMILIVSPWTYRNYKKFGRIIPVSYNSGFNLYINNNENNTHGGWQSMTDIYTDKELDEKIEKHMSKVNYNIKLASDIELDFKPAAVKWIKENPLEFFKLGVIRIDSTYFDGAWDIDSWTMNEYRDELKEELGIKAVRHTNFLRSSFDIITIIISSFGLMFIILNFVKIIVSIFVKSKKVDYLITIPFLNLSYISLVYFVYEGQPRYNFIVLFLLIIATSIIIDKYLEKSK